jgi:ParB-like chromosome segregation protein Spo0J
VLNSLSALPDSSDETIGAAQSIGGAAVTDDAMLTVALHLCDQELSLREIAERLVISTGKKKSQHPSAATVMRMLRDHEVGRTRSRLRRLLYLAAVQRSR